MSDHVHSNWSCVRQRGKIACGGFYTLEYWHRAGHLTLKEVEQICAQVPPKGVHHAPAR